MKHLIFLLVALYLASAVAVASTTEQENLAREKIASADILFKTGDRENAEKKYFEAIKIDNAGWIWVELAKFYYKTEQFEKLLKVTENISKTYPLLNGEVVDIHNKAIEHLFPETRIEVKQLEKYYQLADLIWKGKNSLDKGNTTGTLLFDEISATSKNLEELLTQGQNGDENFADPEDYAAIEAVEKEQVENAKALLEDNQTQLASVATAQAVICKAMATKIIAETFFDRLQIKYKPQATPKEICLNSYSLKNIGP